jgi:ELKS/RAB6-interacting/CAST family protein 1
MRKDSHVNSLEMSLTQKNEEMDILEEKIQRLTKQQQLQTTYAQNQQQLEIDSLKKQCISYQKDVHSKETQIQQLTTELITLKELIDDFEEQKQVLKSKLEQQIVQFSQMEKQFEQTSLDYGTKLKQQEKYYEEEKTALLLKHQNELATLSSSFNSTKEENKADEKVEHINEIENYKQILNLKEQELIKHRQEIQSLYETNDKMRLELEENLNLIKDLSKKLEKNLHKFSEKEIEIDQLNRRILDLEDAIRESVSITAEREYVLAQQKKKMEKIANEVNIEINC